MVALKLQLDRYVYVAGSNLSGRIQIKSDHSTFKVEALEIFFFGIEEISEKTGTTTVCDIKEIVFTADPNKNHPILKDNHVQKGVSYMPFSIPLPENLPSSIETSKNKIIYRLNGRLKGAKEVVEVSRNIDIYESLTTEEKEKALIPTKHTFDKFPVREGFVTVIAHTNKTFYPSGDFVCLLFDIDNNCKSKIEGFKISFIQKRILYLKSKTGAPKQKEFEKMLGEKEYKELESCFSPFERRHVEVIFGIPTIHRIKKSPHLEITFFLRVTVLTSGKQPTFDIPISVVNPLSIVPPPTEWFSQMKLTRRASHCEFDDDIPPAVEDEKDKAEGEEKEQEKEKEKEQEKEQEKEKDEEKEDEVADHIPKNKNHIFPQIPRKNATALEDYHDPDGISFKRGDTIIVSSWFVANWEGKNLGNNTKGSFPKELVQLTN